MKSEKIIDQIQEIRARNNKNWMDLLRLAFMHAPEETLKILHKITECDSEITQLTQSLISIQKPKWTLSLPDWNPLK